MITYPSTHGVFEKDHAVEICDTIHAHGGQGVWTAPTSTPWSGGLCTGRDRRDVSRT